MAKPAMTYAEIEEATLCTMEELYNRRQYGHVSWENIAGSAMMGSTLSAAVKKWAKENGLPMDDIKVKKGALVPPIDDVRGVDAGRVKALRKGGWDVRNIAIDCGCTERAVREILEGK